MAEGSSDINVDDPDFWQKWAEKARLDLDELANKDSLVLDTPRLRRKVNRYGNDNLEEIVDMSDAIDEVCVCVCVCVCEYVCVYKRERDMREGIKKRRRRGK